VNTSHYIRIGDVIVGCTHLVDFGLILMRLARHLVIHNCLLPDQHYYYFNFYQFTYFPRNLLQNTSCQCKKNKLDDMANKTVKSERDRRL